MIKGLVLLKFVQEFSIQSGVPRASQSMIWEVSDEEEEVDLGVNREALMSDITELCRGLGRQRKKFVGASKTFSR